MVRNTVESRKTNYIMYLFSDNWVHGVGKNQVQDTACILHSGCTTTGYFHFLNCSTYVTM